MPICGVVVLTRKEATRQILWSLDKMDAVTTYGVHHDDSIVAVLEAETAGKLEDLTKKISTDQPGVLGVFPAYINFEEESGQIC